MRRTSVLALVVVSALAGGGVGYGVAVQREQTTGASMEAASAAEAEAERAQARADALRKQLMGANARAAELEALLAPVLEKAKEADDADLTESSGSGVGESSDAAIIESRCGLAPGTLTFSTSFTYQSGRRVKQFKTPEGQTAELFLDSRTGTCPGGRQMDFS